MNALIEALGVAAVFAVSGVVVFFATTTMRYEERRRRRAEASARRRMRVKRDLAEQDRLIRFWMAEDYRSERERERRVAHTVVKGVLADEFYALDEAARKAVLTR